MISRAVDIFESGRGVIPADGALKGTRDFNAVGVHRTLEDGAWKVGVVSISPLLLFEEPK